MEVQFDSGKFYFTYFLKDDKKSSADPSEFKDDDQMDCFDSEDDDDDEYSSDFCESPEHVYEKSNAVKGKR